MSTPRKQIAAAFKAEHATGATGKRWIVHDFPTVPATVNKGRPVVAVWRSEIARSSTRLKLDHKITIHGYAAGTGSAAEDEIDELIDGIMLTLERFTGLVLDPLKRQNFRDDTISGVVVEGTVISDNVYRTAVINERSANGTATA